MDEAVQNITYKVRLPEGPPDLDIAVLLKTMMHQNIQINGVFVLAHGEHNSGR